MNLLQFNQKCLIDTAGQIFNKNGEFRNELLMFAEKNSQTVKKENTHIDEQIKYVISSVIHLPKNGNSFSFFREITHRNKLINVGIQVYKKTTFNTTGKGKTSTDVFNWCVFGDHLQEIFRFLPKIKHDNGLISPIRGEKQSRWYSLDNQTMPILKRIAFELRLMHIYVSNSLNLSNSSNSTNSTNTLNSISMAKTRQMQDENTNTNISGVLDLDIKVDYTPLDSLQKKTGINLKMYTEKFMRNHGNPQRQINGEFIYNKNGTIAESLDEIFKIIPSMSMSISLPNIYPHHIWLNSNLSNKTEFQSHIKSMKESDYCIALMSINNHSLFWIKHNKTWFLCDPWQKRFFPGIRHNTFCRDTFDELIGPNDSNESNESNDSCLHWTFLSRKYEEQTSERSCSIASLSRVLQTSVYLQLTENELSFDELNELLNTQIENWSAMLASSLIRVGVHNVYNLHKNKTINH